MIAMALALQLAIALAVAAGFACHRGASLLHPLAFYLAFHLLVFVLRPALVHFAGFDGQWQFMGFTPTPAGFVETLAVASLGLICFAAASLLAGGADAAGKPQPLHLTPPQRRGMWLVAAALLPVALLGAHLDLGLFAQPIAADGPLQRDAASGYTLFVGTTAYLVKAHNLLGPLAALVLVAGRFRWWAWLPLLAFLAFRFYLGSRWGVAIVGGMALLLYLHATGRRWPPLRALAAALPLLLLFHAVGQDRTVLRELFAAEPVRHVRSVAAPAGPLDALDRPDFANFDFLAYIVDRVPERSGTYTYFTQYLALFTHPIPRVLWPDKPVGSPIKLVELNDYGRFTGRTWSLPGDGWLSLGWAGVAVTLAGVGALLGRLHALYRRHADRLLPAVAYCAFLPVTILWFRGGTITSVGRIGMWMLLPVLLWWAVSAMLAALARRRTPARPLPPGGTPAR